MSTFSISAQYVRMSLKESLMYKMCPKWLCWVYLDTNKHFSLQKSTNIYRTPMKFFLQNVAKFRANCGSFSTSAQYVRIVENMYTFSISAQYVRMSLKEPLMYKSCPKWLFWVYLDANKYFSLQKSTKFLMTLKKVCSGSKMIIFEKWLCWVYLDANKIFSLQQIIQNSNEIFLMFFEKWPQVTLLDVEWVEVS